MSLSEELDVLRMSTWIALLVLVLGTAPAGASSRMNAIDQQAECDYADSWVPDGAGIAGVTDDGREVILDVLVLLDGVPRSEAADVMHTVDEMYEPLRISVRPVLRRVTFHVRGPIGDDDLIELSKQAVGGKAPDGSDAVYTLTSRDFGMTAGRADCLEGIKNPETAFAIGQHYPPDEEFAYGPFTFQLHLSAKIAAHELGHLLGGIHEVSNCAEGGDADPTDDALGVCTLMFPDVGLIGSRFGTIEGALIRDLAVRYASP